MALTLADQLKSIRRFVYNIYPNCPIHLERDENQFARPAFLLEHIQTSGSQIMSRVSMDNGSWQVTYYGTDKLDALAVVGEIGRRLTEANEIPGLLFDYVHPAPTSVSSGPGSLPAGTYGIQVTGVGRDGLESLPSPSTTVSLSTTGSLTVHIPRLYLGVGPFRSYVVYVNGRQQGRAPIDGIGNTEYVINSLPLGDAVTPPIKTAVLERYLRISNVMTHTLEETNMDGKHIGVIRFTSRLTVPRRDKVGDKVAHVGLNMTFPRN